MTTAAVAPHAVASRFLDLKALAAVQHLRFTTKQRVEGTFSGRHLSSSKAGSGEFVDYREYSAGEDLRRLDWKVLARTGRTYIRLFQDETNLVCTIVLDASGSMRFGDRGRKHTQTKLEYAQYLATALAQVIGRQQDQVGLAVVADGLRVHVPPGATPGHIGHVQRLVEEVDTVPETRLADGLAKLFQRVHQRGALMILSDFLVDSLEAVFANIRLFRHRRYEVVLLHLIHPDEERLPAGMAYRFEGMENDGVVDCSPVEVAAAYEERFEAYAATVRTLALAAGCDYRRVSTAVPYMQTLSGFLVERTG